MSVLTGRAAAHRGHRSAPARATTSSATSSSNRRFSRNSRTLRRSCLAYDGVNPQPPTYCYLKPTTSIPTRPISSTWPKEPLTMSWDVIIPVLAADRAADSATRRSRTSWSTDRHGSSSKRRPNAGGAGSRSFPRDRSKSRSETSPGCLGDDISEEKPLLDARLPDGSRVAAVFPPCSVARHDPRHSEVPRQAL